MAYDLDRSILSKFQKNSFIQKNLWNWKKNEIKIAVVSVSECNSYSLDWWILDSACSIECITKSWSVFIDDNRSIEPHRRRS